MFLQRIGEDDRSYQNVNSIPCESLHGVIAPKDPVSISPWFLSRSRKEDPNPTRGTPGVSFGFDDFSDINDATLNDDNQ